jgi:hypothetical protein
MTDGPVPAASDVPRARTVDAAAQAASWQRPAEYSRSGAPALPVPVGRAWGGGDGPSQAAAAGG